MDEGAASADLLLFTASKLLSLEAYKASDCYHWSPFGLREVAVDCIISGLKLVKKVRMNTFSIEAD